MQSAVAAWHLVTERQKHDISVRPVQARCWICYAALNLGCRHLLSPVNSSGMFTALCEKLTAAAEPVGVPPCTQWTCLWSPKRAFIDHIMAVTTALDTFQVH
jgi:hypothetical protein